MAERPILMQENSVLAILKGVKTMTRRVIKPQPEWEGLEWSLGDSTDLLRTGKIRGVRCPYGTVGDLLWVRECWRRLPGGQIEYRADGNPEIGDAPPWKSPIYMRKADARIWLQITGMGARKLCSITEEEARREIDVDCYVGKDPKKLFRALWDSINAPYGFGWKKNPWVWVLEFTATRRVS